MQDHVLSVRVGQEEIPTVLCANGESFYFAPEKILFIVNMQRLKNVHAAALSVGKDEAWGEAFLRSPKFRKYLSAKMQEFSDKNSLNVEWWFSFGKMLAEGYRQFYRGRCGDQAGCGLSADFSIVDVEACRKDDMTLEFSCPGCFKPMTMERVREDFRPTREQVAGWQELGARLIPKVERVHHQFEKSEIVFETGGAS